MSGVRTPRRASPVSRALGWLWADDAGDGTAALTRRSPVTWLLGGLIVVVWFASEVLPGRTAVRQALGSSTFDLARGQWWRLFTPGLLNTPDASGRFHSSALEHLVFNLVPLVLVGPRVERALGRVRLLALWVVAELLGRAWLFVAFPVGFGHGGGSSIFTTALQGVALIDAGLRRRSSKADRSYLAVFALVAALEVGGAAFNGRINNNAHAAGLLAGTAVVVGFALHRRWGATVALGLVATLAVGLAADRTFQLHRTSRRIQATIGVGRKPLYVADGGGSIWVSNYGDSTVSRIEPATNRVVATVRLGGSLAAGLAYADGAMWVVDSPRSIVRVDVTTNRVVARLNLPKAASGVAYAPGSVWVSCVGSNVVVRIDTAANRVVATVPVPPRPFELAADSSSVWVASLESATLTRLDPATNRASRTLHTDRWAQAIAIGTHSLWAAGRSTSHGPLNALSLLSSPSHGTDAFLLATDDDQAWATHFDGTVLHFAADGRVIERVHLGLAQSSGIAVANGSIWVTDLANRRLLRLHE